MNAKEIQLYGLIGLRALAEYDPPEYSRAVDMSKRELERKIESGLRTGQNEELQKLYDDLKEILDSTENQIEMSYLLQQIYASSSIRAHFLSMQYRHARSSERPPESFAEFPEGHFEEAKESVLSPSAELARLSAMCLLRDLRGYDPVFNVRLKNIEVDCVLKPESPTLPHIVIEAKSQLPSGSQLDVIIKRLRSVMSAYGRKTIGVVILEHRLKHLNDEHLGGGVYFLVFDIRRNRFTGEEVDNLVRRVISAE